MPYIGQKPADIIATAIDTTTGKFSGTLDVTGDTALSNIAGGVVINEGSANVDFRIESNGNANMLFVDGGDDAVVIGHNASRKTLFNTTGTAALQIEGTSENTAAMSIARNSNDDNGPQLILAKSNGTAGAAVTVVTDDALLGRISFQGADGTQTVEAARIECFVDGTPGANDMPGRITFSTTADGAATVTERTQIDDAGNILVGKTTDAFGTAGIVQRAIGIINLTRSGGGSLNLNRTSNDGVMLAFHKDSTTIGSIGSSSSDLVLFSNVSGHKGLRFGDGQIIPVDNAGADSNNTTDLGSGSALFDDIFASNNAIQTSDRNEKQDIAELSDAETRVAVVAKGLMRKYRWKKAVAEKGDNARTHFGIIAQDLQDAFAAESLDASDYAMFCSDTWWEKEISVDAVEADEANGEEAKDAYTYMDTKDEATDGYTEKTRLGVRYSELLAFIISAI